MAQVITFPIQMQITNLQQILNELQSKLSNLKPGTNGFKSWETSIKRIQSELDRLTSQSSKPVMNASQFTQAEKAIGKIESEIDKLSMTTGRIKFSDLKLDDNQSAQLKSLEKELERIRTLMRSTKELAKQGFLNSDVGKEWLKFDQKASTQSLNEITKSIQAELDTQQELFKAAQQRYNDYQKNFSANQSLQTALQSANPLKDLLGKQFDELMRTDKAGKLTFKSGQRSVFEEWMRNTLSVDESTIQSIMKLGADKIQAAFKDTTSDIYKILSGRTSDPQQLNQYKTEAEALEQKINNLTQTLETAKSSSGSTTTVLAELQKQYGLTKDQINQFMTACVQSFAKTAGIKNSSQSAINELTRLRDILQQTNATFLQYERTRMTFQSLKMATVNFMGFNQVLNLTRTAIRNALTHIRDLDTVMNKISIVTDMKTSDLWGQIDAYTKMAQTYGASIKGAYEVSQIYYQQGLETNDVLTLTNETLKLAKISGLDYANTTDYMTTALRGFKMEMSQASTVVDVYSNLAAHTAVSQEELAIAMSKTASSMEGVGSTFQETSSMIATMVAVTRESATNIGSAMKSIASRYGELTKDPTKLIDDEGEAMAFNKVDAALQSVGISMRTVDGQFRSFTEVITELGEKWSQLDSTQQRYIATQFAGNRQQSRFLALVSNIDLLKSNLNYAENSEDVGTLQALKALDSIESKTEQVRVAYQQMYTDIGAESWWKGILDGAKNVVNTLNGLPKVFNIPVGAITMVADFITILKDMLFKGLSGITKIWDNVLATEAGQQAGIDFGRTLGKGIVQGVQEAAPELKGVGEQAVTEITQGGKAAQQEHTKDTAPDTKKGQEVYTKPVVENTSQQVEKGAAIAENAKSKAAAENEAANAVERQEQATAAAAEKLQTAGTGMQQVADAAKETADALNSIDPQAHVNMLNLQSFMDNHGYTKQLTANLAGTLTSDMDVNSMANETSNIVQQLMNSVPEVKAAMQAAGSDAIQGYIIGILNGLSAAQNVASQVGEGTVQALKSSIQSNSPSKATMEVGKDFADGYALGILSESGKAAAYGQNIGKESVLGLKEGIDEKELEQIKVKLSNSIMTSGRYDINSDQFAYREEYDQAGAVQRKLIEKRAQVEQKNALSLVKKINIDNYKDEKFAPFMTPLMEKRGEAIQFSEAMRVAAMGGKLKGVYSGKDLGFSEFKAGSMLPEDQQLIQGLLSNSNLLNSFATSAMDLTDAQRSSNQRKAFITDLDLERADKIVQAAKISTNPQKQGEFALNKQQGGLSNSAIHYVKRQLGIPENQIDTAMTAQTQTEVATRKQVTETAKEEAAAIEQVTKAKSEEAQVTQSQTQAEEPKLTRAQLEENARKQFNITDEMRAQNPQAVDSFISNYLKDKENLQHRANQQKTDELEKQARELDREGQTKWQALKEQARKTTWKDWDYISAEERRERRRVLEQKEDEIRTNYDDKSIELEKRADQYRDGILNAPVPQRALKNLDTTYMDKRDALMAQLQQEEADKLKAQTQPSIQTQESSIQKETEAIIENTNAVDENLKKKASIGDVKSIEDALTQAALDKKRETATINNSPEAIQMRNIQRQYQIDKNSTEEDFIKNARWPILQEYDARRKALIAEYPKQSGRKYETQKKDLDEEERQAIQNAEQNSRQAYQQYNSARDQQAASLTEIEQKYESIIAKLQEYLALAKQAQAASSQAIEQNTERSQTLTSSLPLMPTQQPQLYYPAERAESFIGRPAPWLPNYTQTLTLDQMRNIFTSDGSTSTHINDEAIVRQAAGDLDLSLFKEVLSKFNFSDEMLSNHPGDIRAFASRYLNAHDRLQKSTNDDVIRNIDRVTLPQIDDYYDKEIKKINKRTFDLLEAHPEDKEKIQAEAQNQTSMLYAQQQQERQRVKDIKVKYNNGEIKAPIPENQRTYLDGKFAGERLGLIKQLQEEDKELAAIRQKDEEKRRTKEEEKAWTQDARDQAKWEKVTHQQETTYYRDQAELLKKQEEESKSALNDFRAGKIPTAENIETRQFGMTLVPHEDTTDQINAQTQAYSELNQAKQASEQQPQTGPTIEALQQELDLVKQLINVTEARNRVPKNNPLSIKYGQDALQIRKKLASSDYNYKLDENKTVDALKGRQQTLESRIAEQKALQKEQTAPSNNKPADEPAINTTNSQANTENIQAEAEALKEDTEATVANNQAKQEAASTQVNTIDQWKQLLALREKQISGTALTSAEDAQRVSLIKDLHTSANVSPATIQKKIDEASKTAESTTPVQSDNSENVKKEAEALAQLATAQEKVAETVPETAPTDALKTELDLVNQLIAALEAKNKASESGNKEDYNKAAEQIKTVRSQLSSAEFDYTTSGLKKLNARKAELESRLPGYVYTPAETGAISTAESEPVKQDTADTQAHTEAVKEDTAAKKADAETPITNAQSTAQLEAEISALQRLIEARKAAKEAQASGDENAIKKANAEKTDANNAAKGLGIATNKNDAQLQNLLGSKQAELQLETANQVAGQLKFDLDSTTPENTIVVPIEPAPIEPAQVEEKVAEVEGQIKMELPVNVKPDDVKSGDVKPVQLGASLDSVLNMQTGEAMDLSAIQNLLNELQKAGIIIEETKNKLLELYNTKPSEDFVLAYGAATGTPTAIAGANKPMEYPKTHSENAEPVSNNNQDYYESLQRQQELDEFALSRRQEAARAAAEAESAYAAARQQSTQVSEHAAQAEKLFSDSVDDTAAALMRQQQAAEANNNKLSGFVAAIQSHSKGLSTFGASLSMISGLFDKSSRSGQLLSGAVSVLGGALRGVLPLISALLSGGPIPWMQVAMGIMAIVNGLSMAIETDQERLERYTKEAEELGNKAKEAKANFNSLDTGKKKLEELEQKRYDNAESAEEYQKAVDDLADKFPALVSGFDEAGNAIIETGNMENVLAEARRATAKATYEAAKAEQTRANEQAAASVKAAKTALGTFSLTAFSQNEVESKHSNAVNSVINASTSGLSIFKDIDLFQASDDGLRFIIESANGSGASFGEDLNLEDAYQISAMNQIGQLIEQSYDSFAENGIYDYSKLKEILSSLNSVEANELIAMIDGYSNKEVSMPTLQDAVTKATTALEAGNYTEAYSYYSDIQKYAQELMSNLSDDESKKEIQKTLDAVEKSFDDLKAAALIEEKASDALFTAWIADNNQMADFVKDNSTLSNQIAQHFSDVWHTQYKGQKWEDVIIKLGPEINEAVEATEVFWDSLSLENDERVKRFKEMINKPELYRWSDVQAEFGTLEGFDQIAPLLQESFDRQVQTIQENIQNKYEQLNKDNKKDLKNDYGMTWRQTWKLLARRNAKTFQEQGVYTDVLNNYQSLVDSGFESSASDYMKAGLKFANAFTKLTGASHDLMSKYLKDYDISTRAGLSDLLTKISNDDNTDNDVMIEYIEAMIATWRENISLSIQAMIENFTSNWSDQSKTLKSLTSGMGIEDVQKVLTQAKEIGYEDISFKDFVTDGDKLVLAQDKAEDYWNKYFEYQRGKINELTTIFNTASTRYGLSLDENGKATISKNVDKWTEFDENAVKQLEDLGVDYSKYLTLDEKSGKWKPIDPAKSEEFVNAIKEAYEKTDKLIPEFESYIEWATNEFKKSADWDKGDYSSLINKDKGITSKEEVYTELQRIAKGGNLQDWQKALPDWKNAAENIQTATGNLLSDILSKGINNINLEDYKGLTNIDIMGKSYEQIISEYGEQTGKSIDELNDLYAQAMEKDAERVSSQVLKDLTFLDGDKFETSLSGLRELSKVYDIPLENLEKFYNAATEKATLSVSELLSEFNIDLTVVHQYTDTIQDSIDETFSNLISIIKNGINGSMKYSDINKLQTALSQQGFNQELRYTKTENGYQLTEGSVNALYEHLSTSGSLAAESILKEINDSYIEKVEKATAKFSSKLLSDIEFLDPTHVQTSLSGLNALANTFGLSVANMIQKYYNAATEKATFSLDQLNKDFSIDLRSVNNFTDTIQKLVDDALNKVTNKLKSSISGNMVFDDIKELQTWIDQQDWGEGNKAPVLDAYRTKEGYKLTADSLGIVYNKLQEIDSISADIVLDQLNSSLDTAINLSAQESEILQKIATESGLSKDDLEFVRSFNGNTDFFHRPILPQPDGSIKTYYTSTISSGPEATIPWVMNITPITPDGQELDKDTVNEYVDKLFTDANGDLQKVLELDKKDRKLIVDLQDATNKDQQALIDQMSADARRLSSISNKFHNTLADRDNPSNARIAQYQKELELNQEIQRLRATTESDDFKFMDKAIPSGQNNPLNYFENWGKALKTFKESFEATGTDKGMIGYKDLYNVITEMGNLAQTTGKAIPFGNTILNNAKDASNLITKAAEALTVTADGSIKVDLSKLGVDFVGGAEAMGKNVDAGIDALADSQIKMLDGMIQLLETIVAMEELGKIDVEGNGIDFDELFEGFIDKKTGKQMYQWKKGAQEAANNILELAQTNKDLADGLKLVNINGITMGDMLKKAKDGIALNEADAQAYYATLAAFYKALQSGDWNLDNIYQSIKEVLSSTGFEGEITVGDMKLKFRQGVVLERDEKGNIKVGDFVTKDEDAALRAMKTSTIQALQAASISYNKDTGEAIYTTDKIRVETHYDIDSQTYSASFSDGGYVTANSQDALNIAIRTYLKAQQIDLTSNSTDSSTSTNVQKFSITIPGEATINYEITEVEGKTTIKRATPGAPSTEKEARVEAATKVIEVEKNETKEALGENKEEADKGVTQDIKNETNETGDAIIANIAAAAIGVVQNIHNETNAVRDAIDANIAYAKEHAAVQTIKASTIVNTGVAKEETQKPAATGTIGLAKSKGTSTLMGELGPELVVSNGRYYVVGQHGPEFIDLADDAIVFNHLQTKQLLQNGMSPTRGQAVTNERNAIAFASGNVNGGPAQASASQALAALKQLRAMWQALQKSSVKDLAGKGGGGGGGGGGKQDSAERQAWIEAVERWYNLMQQIAKLERDITHEEALRTKLQGEFKKNGSAYYLSQKRTLQALEQQSQKQMQLNISQEEYFNQRRAALNASEFNRLYTFDENGVMQYNDSDLGFAWLSDLVKVDEYGNTKYTNEEQYNMIVAQGYGAYMQQDSSGKLIEKEKDENGEEKEDQTSFYAAAIEAWWDTIDGQKEEMESLRETIDDGKTKVLELEASRNEILKEIRDNQMKVEDDVLKALESSRQQQIDALSDERKALQDSTNKYIEGLSNALNQEREMYEQQQNAEELNRLRRQLDILRRSGGSGSQIRSLESEISSREKDSYFDQQQSSIDAIKEASDLQLERLDTQIEVMTEALEYEKEFGLLWGEVYQIMAMSPEQIAGFIFENDTAMWGSSPLRTEEDFQEALFAAEQWNAFYTDQLNYYNDEVVRHAENLATMNDAVYGDGSKYNWGIFDSAMTDLYGRQWEAVADQYKDVFMKNYSKTGDITYAATEITNALNSMGKQMTSALESSYSAYQAASAPAADSGSGGGGGSGSGSGNSNSGSKTKTTSETPKSYVVYASYTGDDGVTYRVTGTGSTYDNAYRSASEQIPPRKQMFNVRSTTKYDQGGMVPEDQMALVHAKEAVLTAQQASILRNDILGSSPNSLMNLLLNFKNAYAGMASQSDYNTIDRGLVIENANVNMNVQKIANDYDAQRAGEQALTQILNIARKTSAKNSIRR